MNKIKIKKQDRVLRVKACDLISMIKWQKYRGGFEGLMNRESLKRMLLSYGLTEDEVLQCL